MIRALSSCRSLLLGFLVLLAPAMLAACGGSSTTPAATTAATTAAGTTSTATSAATPRTSASSASAATPMVTASPSSLLASPATGAASPTAGPTLMLRSDPKLGQIVTDSAGRTLYIFKKDPPGASACTGACATTWPPLTATGTPTSAAGVTGQLDTITRDDGSQQVTLDGMPLYRYAADTAPGDTKGQGVGGSWFVETANGPATPTS